MTGVTASHQPASSARIQHDDGERVIGLFWSATRFHEQVVASQKATTTIEEAASRFGVAIAHYFAEESTHLSAARSRGQTDSGTFVDSLMEFGEESETFAAARYALDLAEIVWPDREIFSDRIDSPENSPETAADHIYDALKAIQLPKYEATVKRIRREFNKAIAISHLADDAQAAAILRPQVRTDSGERERPETERQTESTVKPQKRRKKINLRMMDTIQKNPEAIGWTCRQFGIHLDCSPSQVVSTTTWKNLKMQRLQMRAERTSDRRRRSRGK